MLTSLYYVYLPASSKQVAQTARAFQFSFSLVMLAAAPPRWQETGMTDKMRKLKSSARTARRATDKLY
jgi:hypothetical protein